MEDEEGYMKIERTSMPLPLPVPKKSKGPSANCRKKTVGILLAGSIALNAALITFLIVSYCLAEQTPVLVDLTVFQGTNNDSTLQASLGSCDWIPGSKTDRVTFDRNISHPWLYVSKDQKRIRWGKMEKLPNDTEKFNERSWVLGQVGFLSGKQCWVVEVKGSGEWAVGVARQSVKKTGLRVFGTAEGIWAIGEYWGLGNYVAFTSPQPTKLTFDRKPRMIRVFLDYSAGMVEFFNPEAKVSIYTFNSAAFSGEKVYPWFRVWEEIEFTLHP